MPPYLLDTDHCIAYVQAGHPAHVSVARRIEQTSIRDMRVSQFTVMELAEGPWHSESLWDYHVARSAIHTFLTWMPILDPTPITLEEFGRIRAYLRQ